METLVFSSSYSLPASKLCLLLAFATLLFLPSHVLRTDAATVVPDYEHSQSLQPSLLRMGASQRSSTYLMKAGRKLLAPAVASPPVSTLPTPVSPGGKPGVPALPSSLPPPF